MRTHPSRQVPRRRQWTRQEDDQRKAAEQISRWRPQALFAGHRCSTGAIWRPRVGVPGDRTTSRRKARQGNRRHHQDLLRRQLSKKPMPGAEPALSSQRGSARTTGETNPRWPLPSCRSAQNSVAAGQPWATRRGAT